MLILTLPYLSSLWVQLERPHASPQYIYQYQTFETFQSTLQNAYLGSCLRKEMLSSQLIVDSFILMNQIMLLGSFKLSKGFPAVRRRSSQSRGTGRKGSSTGELEGGPLCLE